jgi:hypothetical protein
MKKLIKFAILLILMLGALLVIPNISNAATLTANDEESLNNVISSSNNGDTIEIENNITITKPIVIQKELIIDGNGFTLTGADSWTSTSGNQTMITAQLSEGKLTLKDIKLNNGPKYGVQAYDGATVILDNVSVTGFKYGGVLVNGGNIEVRNLHLGYNGTNENNGIEIDKGPSATNNPTITMNGSLTSESSENVVRPATNGNLTEFTITNTENTINKVVLAGNKVVLTDEYNNVISESSVPETITVNSEKEKVIISLIIGDETKRITVNKDEKITKELLESHIELDDNYKLEGFFTDKNYETEFDFDKELIEDTTIYAKITKIESNDNENIVEDNKEVIDETPKTGIESYIGVAVLAIIFSVIVIAIMKKRGIKG